MRHNQGLPRNGTGHLPLIGQKPKKDLSLKLVPIETPAAFPTQQTVPNEDGVQVFVMGGLTKLEWMAGQVAVNANWSMEAPDIGVDQIVQRAAMLLQACHDYEHRTPVAGGRDEDLCEGGIELPE